MPTEELKQDAAHYLMQTYTRQPISIVRGRGTKVYDLEGREYLDFVGGIAVNILGHGHPDLVQAIQQQAAQLIHTSNLYYTEPQVKLAQMLVDHSFADKVFFCNSGAEANEAAIKLARRYSHRQVWRRAVRDHHDEELVPWPDDGDVDGDGPGKSAEGL